MNQQLKRSEESRFRTPCKYTASPATSRINTQLIYLLPAKETAIITFALRAAASCIPSSAPPCSHGGRAPLKALPSLRGPHSPSSSPALGIQPWPPDHSLLPQNALPHCARETTASAGAGGNGFHRQKRLPWKSVSAEN